MQIIYETKQIAKEEIVINAITLLIVEWLLFILIVEHIEKIRYFFKYKSYIFKRQNK